MHPGRELVLVDVRFVASVRQDRAEAESERREVVSAAEVHAFDAAPQRVRRLSSAARSRGAGQAGVDQSWCDGLVESGLEVGDPHLVDPPVRTAALRNPSAADGSDASDPRPSRHPVVSPKTSNSEFSWSIDDRSQSLIANPSADIAVLSRLDASHIEGWVKGFITAHARTAT